MFIETESGAALTTESGQNLLTQGLFPAPLQNVIPSYLYQEYADDADLQAFVASFNAIAQGYLDWANQTPLAVYTSPNISGPLLDWIAQGIYGITRPVFSSLITHIYAGLNALPINVGAVNGIIKTESGTAVTATDDYYKRTLTWWLYAGNGKNFNVEWLRLRVARFLYGVNGSDITLSQAQTVHILAGSVSPPFPIPTLASVAGGSFSTRKYGARYTYVTALGEGLPGPAASLSVAANHLLESLSPDPANGAESWNVYVGIVSVAPPVIRAGLNSLPINVGAINGTNVPPPVSTPMTRQNLTPIPIGTAWTEPSSGLVDGDPLPTVDHSNTAANFIITVPSAAGPAADFFQQAFEQGLLSFPLQLAATVVIA